MDLLSPSLSSLVPGNVHGGAGGGVRAGLGCDFGSGHSGHVLWGAL